MACAQHRRGRPRGRAQKALHVTINDYQRTDGSAFRSNDHDATVPGGLDIQAVVGLDTYAQAATTNVRTYNGVQGYFPNDFRTAYDMDTVSTTAGGQVIGLTLWAGKVAQPDLHTFAAQSGTPELVAGQSGDNGIDWIGVNGNPMTDTSQLDETAMDSEYSHGVAPGSHLKFWLAPCSYDAQGNCGGDSTGLANAIDLAAKDPAVHVVSNSWGFRNITAADARSSLVTTIDTSLQRGVAGGTTFYFATGDNGANSGCVDKQSPPCPPWYPASSRYAVAVGGTTLNTNSDFTYQSESAWSGSGGGCATYFARPSWQTNVTATDNGSTCTGRATPDVAAAGDPTTGAIVYYQGKDQAFGGTSLATPLWAGMTADIDFSLGSDGFFLAGFLVRNCTRWKPIPTRPPTSSTT